MAWLGTVYMQSPLFDENEGFNAAAPLAQRLRPRTLDEFVGQSHLTGPGRLIRRLYENRQVASLIFWGPPGVGKTTLARLLARRAAIKFVEFSAVLSGVKEVREVLSQAKADFKYTGQSTVLFVDEIHRFNKAQQDGFLPHVEAGLITLIGATTENPSFEVIPALISRTRVLVLNPLTENDLNKLADFALNDRERGLGALGVRISPEAREFLIRASGGDARALLNSLELSAALARTDDDGRRNIGLDEAQEAVQRKAWRYDKGGEEHYNLISALHKSLRDSDPDGALYWLARMLDGGEDPLYLLRRLVRFASEDVGLADPVALMLAAAAVDSYRLLGSPEGELAIAHLTLYLALADKSNSAYKAFNAALKDVRDFGPLDVPLVIRNAPTKLMKNLGYGRGYKYAHDYENAVVDQEHLPEKLAGRKYYQPTGRGREKALGERLAYWRGLLKPAAES